MNGALRYVDWLHDSFVWFGMTRIETNWLVERPEDRELAERLAEKWLHSCVTER